MMKRDLRGAIANSSLEPIRRIVRRHGYANEEALSDVDAESPHAIHLCIGFDAFRSDSQAEFVCKRSDSLDDGGGGPEIDLLEKRAVDFQRIHGKALQVA
jgi:hypothetical protein